MQQTSGGKGSTLPEYMEQAEVEALIRAAQNPQAALLMLTQCGGAAYARYRGLGTGGLGHGAGVRTASSWHTSSFIPDDQPKVSCDAS